MDGAVEVAVQGLREERPEGDDGHLFLQVLIYSRPADATTPIKSAAASQATGASSLLAEDSSAATAGVVSRPAAETAPIMRAAASVWFSVANGCRTSSAGCGCSLDPFFMVIEIDLGALGSASRCFSCSSCVVPTSISTLRRTGCCVELDLLADIAWVSRIEVSEETTADCCIASALSLVKTEERSLETYSIEETSSFSPTGSMLRVFRSSLYTDPSLSVM
eukprot:XP_001708343.1 Hypothetical protein GL50803_32456 [Giardia lamblia ATCC 50803]